MPRHPADLHGKGILFIAYFFPPIDSTGVPGAMRTVKFVRNLNNGRLHVLTTEPAVADEDSALNHLSFPVNNEIIHRVKPWDIFKLLLVVRHYIRGLLQGKQSQNNNQQSSPQTVFKGASEATSQHPSKFQQLKDFVYNLCYFPDQAGPWMLPAFFKGKRIVREEKLDIIFATGSPWSGLLAGYLISKVTGKPLITDFRDPWTNNPFHHSKGKMLDNWSKRLERKIVNHSSAISLNTEALKEEFTQQYGHLSPDKFFVMPNGFDEIDLPETTSNSTTSESNVVTLCHTGFLYGVRDPEVLLNAIQIANKTLKLQNKLVRFRQIGNVELAYDIKERFSDMLDDGSLILDTSIPYLDCIAALNEADWVVNVQPGTKTQIPSKLYDYLAINRPIINITPHDGALGQLVSKHHLGKLFGFHDQETLSNTLIAIAEEKSTENTFNGYAAREQFNCKKIAETLAAKILTLTGR